MSQNTSQSTSQDSPQTTAQSGTQDPSFAHVLIERHDKVAVVRLNRPASLNALAPELTQDMSDALAFLDADAGTAVIILTGSDRAFAAGADIKFIQSLDYMDMYKDDFVAKTWESVARTRKPIIAAVAGYALGGGCEIAMMCDFILCADNAKFGQPEITIGTIPGAGGTQRLTRFVGKSKAMEMILTGRTIDAHEAERIGLVARVLPLADLMTDAIATAQRMAALSQPVLMMAKDAVNRAYESTMQEGVHFERSLFHATFAMQDQKEGMKAFAEKRKAVFVGK